MIEFDVKVNVDEKRIKQRAEKGISYAQYVLDNQVLKDTEPFLPADTFNLRDSGIMHSKPGEGHLEWKTPYARRLYYNPQFNFSTDKHPKAQGLWFEASKAENKKDWVEIAQKAFNKAF